MGQPVLLSFNGVVSSAPAAAPNAPALSEILDLSVKQAFQASKSVRLTINNPGAGAPYVIPFEGITVVRFVAIIAWGAPIDVYLTSTKGADQVVPVSDRIVISSPSNAGFTAIKLVGVGDVTYLLAGDAN